MSVGKKILLLDKLQTVLQKQIRLARQGDVSNAESLARQAGLLMEKVTESGVLELTEFKNHRQKLQSLYKNLCLTIAAQKTEIADQLSRVRKGRKTIGAYRNVGRRD